MARVMHENMGINMGDEFPTSNWTTPDGNYEDKEIHALTGKFYCGENTWDQFMLSMQDIIRFRAARDIEWGFKSPRMAYFLGLILVYVGTPKIIRVDRDRDLTVASFKKCWGHTDVIANMRYDFVNRNLSVLLEKIDHLVIHFGRERKTEEEVQEAIETKWNLKKA